MAVGQMIDNEGGSGYDSSSDDSDQSIDTPKEYADTDHSQPAKNDPDISISDVGGVVSVDKDGNVSVSYKKMRDAFEALRDPKKLYREIKHLRRLKPGPDFDVSMDNKGNIEATGSYGVVLADTALSAKQDRMTGEISVSFSVRVLNVRRSWEIYKSEALADELKPRQQLP